MEEAKPNRSRSRQVKFWVSEEEYQLLKKKMEAAGGVNQGAYIRKMILDGYIVKLDIPELKEIIRLLDRARLSMKNRDWQDASGRVFVLYTIPNLAKDIGKGETTVKKALNQLVQQELICKQSLGAGQPNKIYVKTRTENSPTGQTEKRLTGGVFFDPKTGRKVPPNNNKSNKYVRNYEPKEGVSL